MDVELRHIRLKLGASWVLRDIDWRIRPREHWVLMGPNGAGKTQLLKLLAGEVWPTPTPGSLRRYRCRAEVYVDPYGIKEELAYVGPERQDRYEHYEWNHRVEHIVGTGMHRTDIPLAALSAPERRQVEKWLARFGIARLAQRRFLTLSYGERRLVLLARALAWQPKLLLLDEPFSGLDSRNRERLAAGLRGLSRSGLPWVLSTHRVEDVPAAATHCCELESGRIVARGPVTNRLRVAATARSRRIRRAVRAPTGARVLVALRYATVFRGGARVLRKLSLAVRAGDCWVIHGANGSGKSTLIQTLYGDLGVARGGAIARDGIVAGVPLWEFQRRVGLVAPELQASHPRGERAGDVVASGLYASIGLDQRVRAHERRRVQRALRRVGAGSLIERRLRTLSYGQLRRVLFARALVNEPDMLLLDEPFAGLDPQTRTALQVLVERAIGTGTTAVMTTHHIDEWPANASHELELVDGRARYCGPVRRA